MGIENLKHFETSYRRGLWPGSKVCSEHMNDWQYLSLGDLEQKVNL